MASKPASSTSRAERPSKTPGAIKSCLRARSCFSFLREVIHLFPGRIGGIQFTLALFYCQTALSVSLLSEFYAILGYTSVVSHKSLDFGCHSERSEESRLFKYMRPFTSFRVTRKTFFSILLM